MAEWDRDEIIAALTDRRSRGLPLDARSVRKSDSRLARAIRKRFGSHDAALAAFGVNPAKARQAPKTAGRSEAKAAPAPPPIRHRGDRWDKAGIIAALRQRHASGLALNAGMLRESVPGLYGAAFYRFGSYKAAVAAAGVDPTTLRKWSQAKIVAALRERQAKGLKLDRSALTASDSPLEAAICSYFGSYDEALGAAGIDPDSVRKYHRAPDNDAILAELREIAKDGCLSNARIKSANYRLLHLSRRRFGTVEAAVAAAGLQYVRREPGIERVHRWNPQRVLALLREQHQGRDPSSRIMQTQDLSLYFAARRLFGSYANALRRAGIECRKTSQEQPAKGRAAEKPATDR